MKRLAILATFGVLIAGGCAGYEVRDGQCLYRGINEAVGRWEKVSRGNWI